MWRGETTESGPDAKDNVACMLRKSCGCAHGLPRIRSYSIPWAKIMTSPGSRIMSSLQTQRRSVTSPDPCHFKIPLPIYYQKKTNSMIKDVMKQIILLKIKQTYSIKCCGSGSKLDAYSATLWIHIRIPNTNAHRPKQDKLQAKV